MDQENQKLRELLARYPKARRLVIKTGTRRSEVVQEFEDGSVEAVKNKANSKRIRLLTGSDYIAAVEYFSLVDTWVYEVVRT